MPNAQQFDIVTRRGQQEAYAAARGLGLFISFHSGVHQHRIADYNLLKFDEVAWQFPDLHFGPSSTSAGGRFLPEAVAVITNNIPFPPVPGRKCRVYGGLTSVFTPHYNRLWYMPRDRMLELIAQVGMARAAHLRNLDFPYNLEENTKMGINAIESLGLSEAQRAMIFGGNLRELIGIR